jgi:hypothetical protein
MPKLTDAVLAETRRERKLRKERLAWQAEHPKPWYLINKKS